MSVVREDAVPHRGRFIVPISDATRWVTTWAEFKAAGGTRSFSEDQTAITLTLPAPWKFSIQFLD